MMLYFMVLCLAYIIECHPADYRQQPYIVRKYSSKSHGVPFRNAVMPTTPSVKYSNSRDLRQEALDSLPNITFSFMKASYGLKFKGVAMQTLIIRRAPNATIGAPWPLPYKYVVNNSLVFIIRKETLKINIRNNSCDVLEKAVERFKENIFKFSLEEYYTNLVNIDSSGFFSLDEKYEQLKYTKALDLTTLHIYVNSKCDQYPSVQSDESYNLLVKSFGIVLMSGEIWGALRGLETLSQLIFSWKGQLYVRDTVIRDFPRFKHRGVLIDSARHFMRKQVIFDVLEGMYQNKMNVLHWHMVDDQSFTYASKVFPDLSAKGSYHPSLVYTQEDIKEIIEFARLRGIRVMPEFDTPGHTYAWAFGYPHLVTQCYEHRRKVAGYYGPLNPARNTTFDFLGKLFSEVFDVFPERFVHLGGDEVPLECWVSNPEVNDLLNRLNRHKAPSYSYNTDFMKPVWEYYTNRLLQILKKIRRSKGEQGEYILWEEASKNNLDISKDTIIQIWMGGGNAVQKAIDQGYRVLFSSCWYLDHSNYGIHWMDYYNCEPTHRINSVVRNEHKILGGEVCLWSEYITSETAMSVLWPRASAAAERLWSSSDVTNVDEASTRLQEQRCRMLRRGLQVGHINGPDYCMLPKYTDDLNRDRKRNIYKRSAYQVDDTYIEYPPTIFKRINNIEPLVMGLAFSTSGVFFILLFICLKFKSRVFVICWTLR